jgi:iron-sulfur cluster insertion protein
MITLTDKAVAKLKEFAEDEGLKHSIRVKVVGGACAGLKNDLMFEENTLDTDEVFEDKGIKIIVDMLSIQYVDGSIIDYVEGVFESGFTFKNPNMKSSCGCGNSYSV